MRAAAAITASLVLELVQRRLHPITKIGAHIAQDKARIDFQHAENIAGVLPEIASEVRAVVGADQPILSAFADEARGLRYWEIAAFSRVPCGGTHLRTTGEVGEIELKRKNPGKA
ncbi:MAG: alanyl-tRNA editing protein, partial [Solirubrobacteraceae bacterium]